MTPAPAVAAPRPEAEEDSRLIARINAGDQSAFEELVRRWKGRVYRLCLRFFREADAEDLTQEVFLKVYRSARSYRGTAPVAHWLLRIATNACRDRIRVRQARPEQLVSELSDDAGAWPDAALGGRALAAAEAEAARMLAADLLDRLPARDRVVLVLLDLEGMPAAEVAAATGLTRAAVKVRAMRARRALRKIAETVGRGRETR